jgi:signal transduction histidine kinase
MHFGQPSKMWGAAARNCAAYGLRQAGVRRRATISASTIRLFFMLAAVLPVWASAQGQADKLATNTNLNEIELDPKYGVGAWIWAAETRDQQLCRFWRGFEIPEGTRVAKADLRVTADDSYNLFLDGRELGRGGGWQDVTEYDLTSLLDPGLHTLAIEGFNDFKEAGVLVGLHVELTDGKTIDIPSDQNWKLVPNTEDRWVKRTRARANWPQATVVKVFGVPPWGKKFAIIKAPEIYPIVLQFWQTGWFQIMLLSLCAIVATMCLRLMGKLAMHSQAEQVVQRERARIARDIHDDLTAGLTQLVLLGEVAQSELPAGSEPRQHMSQVCEKARSLSRSMNEIIWAVNSQRDTSRDFVSYVCKYTETFLQPTAIRCRFDLEEDMPDTPCDLGVRRNLFLAVKEALHNAVRHSNATELVMRVRRQGAEVLVVVEDNGKGFDPVLADCAGNGLSNMMKRAAEAGGSFAIISQLGGGCRVEFIAPLAGRAPRPYNWLGQLRKRPASPVAKPRIPWPVGIPPDSR